MAERDGEKGGGPKPPAVPRPRGAKKGDEKDEKEGSPRKAGREGRKADASLDGDGNSKKGSRHANRKSKEKLISDNWRPQFEQFLASNDGESFAQTNRASMYLQFIPLSSDEFIVLTRALSANIPLRSLSLSSCWISDDQCQKLSEALTKNTSIRKLDLSWNPISESSASAILELIKSHPHLDDINLLGTSLTQESQQRVLSAIATKRQKDGAASGGADSPESPRAVLNTVHLNELALKYFDNPANLEQNLRQLRLANDDLKYLVITLAERLKAASKPEKMLEVLLIGHRQLAHDLAIVYRLCRIYWELGNAQPASAREMYYSVGLSFAERALLLDEKHVHPAFDKWQRNFTAALAAPQSMPPPTTPPNSSPRPEPVSPRVPGSPSRSAMFEPQPPRASPRLGNRPLAASAVFAKRKEKKSKSREGLNELAGGQLERKRSYTTENIPTSFAVKDVPVHVLKPAPLVRDFKSDLLPKSHIDPKAENEELRSQLSVLYEELSRLKKKERDLDKSSSSRDSPSTSAPGSPHPTEYSKQAKKEEELDQRIAFQSAQLSALNVQLQTVTTRLENARKQVTAMKEEERTLQQSIARLTRKEQKVEARRAKQQGVIGKLNLTNIVINEALSRGRGGSGATVHACSVDGWSCACKELDITDLVSTGDGEEGFMQEVALLERLPYHPNIVKYLFHEKIGPRVRLFMTRYHSNLTDYMTTRTTGFTPAAIVKYAIDILAGLEFLHKNQVLHRDLKSDNIFVMLNEKKEICQLAIGDFDVARRMKLDRGPGRQVVGTPYIMAPEVLMRQEYSFPSDIFSFGMVLFELMAMKRPYEGRLFEVPDLIVGGVPPDLPPQVLSEASFTNIVRTHRACLRLKGSERPTIDEIRGMLAG